LHGHVPDAVSCFAHSLVAVDREWNALTPILGWRDTRSAGAAERLGKQLDAERIHARTGAFLHPSYWPAKLAWLAEDEPEIFRRAEWFVSFADYIRGVPETSVSMASCTRVRGNWCVTSGLAVRRPAAIRASARPTLVPPSPRSV